MYLFTKNAITHQNSSQLHMSPSKLKDLHLSSCHYRLSFFWGGACRIPVFCVIIPVGGGISLYNVSCASLTKNSCNTKMVFSHFDSDSCGSSLWQSKGSEAWRESVWIPRPVAVALAHREAPRIHSVIPGCVSATVRSCNVISWPEPR